MNFEEFESAWTRQAALPPPSAQTTLSVRGRLLGYQAGLLAFTLLFYPLLSFANFGYLRPASPALFWLNVAVHEGIFLALIVHTLRRVIRHRRLRCQNSESLRAYHSALLRATEAEMRDTRSSSWLVPLFVALALLSGYQNNAGNYGWRLFATQVGILAIVVVPILAAAWVRYFRTLQRDQTRLRLLLREMDGGPESRHD